MPVYTTKNFTASARNKIETAIAAIYGYPPTVAGDEGEEIPNPQTRGEFVEAQLDAFLIKETNAFICAQKTREAEESARDEMIS